MYETVLRPEEFDNPRAIAQSGLAALSANDCSRIKWAETTDKDQILALLGDPTDDDQEDIDTPLYEDEEPTE